MSSGAPVNVTFGADVAQIYSAYAEFRRYVAANPVSVGPAGLGLSAQQLQAPFQQALGAASRNAAQQFIGELSSSASRASGGSGFLTGRGAGRGPLERLLTASVLAHGALRAGQGYAEYLTETGGSAGERLQAEQRLQQRLFSIPYIGQAAELATFPFRAGTEATAHQAQLGGQQAELMQKQLDMTRHAMQRASEYGAGSSGSYDFQKLQFQHEAERENLAARRFETERVEQAARLREDTQQARHQQAERQKAMVPWGALPGSHAWDQIIADRDKDIRAAEANANATQAQAKRDRDRIEQANEKVRQAREAELQYQQQQAALHAGQSADVAKLEYQRKPQVAEARGTYNEGTRAAEAYRHAGNWDAAAAAVEEARYRLLYMRDEIQKGGFAEVIGNARSLDLSGTDTSLKGRLGSDDSDEALKEIREEMKRLNELAQKIAAKI